MSRGRRRGRYCMRTLAVTENTTVDGSIEMLGDWFDPQGQGEADSSDLMEELHRQEEEHAIQREHRGEVDPLSQPGEEWNGGDAGQDDRADEAIHRGGATAVVLAA